MAYLLQMRELAKHQPHIEWRAALLRACDLLDGATEQFIADQTAGNLATLNSAWAVVARCERTMPPINGGTPPRSGPVAPALLAA